MVVESLIKDLMILLPSPFGGRAGDEGLGNCGYDAHPTLSQGERAKKSVVENRK
jgi:hypothetical protein